MLLLLEVIIFQLIVLLAIAKDLRVITTPNNHIITMYPIYLSGAYNAEGYATSSELALKRERRGIK